MDSLNKQIQKARPRLKTVTPLAYWIITVFAYFNLLLGISLFLAVDQTKITNSLLIVNEVLTYKFWGIVFVVVGVVKLSALHTNNWKLSRRSLLLGVGIKAAWAVALIIRCLTSPDTVFVMLIWVSLALIQIVTFIFFMPPSVASYKQRREVRDGS